ncbi:MAG: protease modulator HflK [Lentisphaeria bacterium]|nr:protease modulator HflK [Lentisphaeria bacterium]MBO5900180.1 protease modulator HflK [Lentisphaeria bacterium]MBO7152500.1 protease modulator HflK [Lentisphaeria bacterium]
MANENEIRTAIDAGKLNTKLSTVGWILSAVMLVVCIIMSSVRGGNVFMLGCVPFALALLFGLGSMIYAMLSTSAAQESEEKELLSRRRAESRALDVDEDVRFTAGRSFENYCRFAPYVLSVIGALVLGVILFITYRTWSQVDGGAIAISGNPIDYALIAAVMMLVSVFAGAFFIGQSRTPNFRWLRPVGAWLVVGFAVLACAAAGALCYKNNLLYADYTLAKIISWIFVLLGAEFISNFVIEFYRPRTIIETRPVFESRLLALFTEPGGVMRNIASALDYQFGFKISSTGIYSFIERAFFPILLLWAAVFWLSTSICEVGPSQYGVRESFGKVIDKELLKPGIYLTLPRPFGKLRTVSCSEIQRVVIGEFADGGKKSAVKDDTPDDGHGHSKPKADPNAGKPKQVLTWTDEHGTDEDNFIVAVPVEKGKNASPEEEAASISFLRLAIPIQYRVRPDGVMNYLYGNSNPVTMLIRIGERVATRYLASSSMMEIIATGRSSAEEDMRKEVQKLADEANLGIEITAVNILGAHPPVGEVATAFQNVISAMEEKETTILAAKSYRTTTLPESEVQALALIADANSYKYRTATVAKAENKRFGNQLLAYKAMPEMFVLRSYLDFLRDDCSHIRKYVMSPNNTSEVFQINLEQKERLDLTDADIAAVPSK